MFRGTSQFIHKHFFATSSHLIVLVVSASLSIPCLAQDTTGEASETTQPKSKTTVADKSSEKPLEYWIEDLGHDQYLRRERATDKLIKAGKAAVPALIQAIRKGDLETTTRAIGILNDLALEQSPNDESGAWGELNRIATQSSGSRQAMAMDMIGGIRTAREQLAVDALRNADVTIGFGKFVAGALERPSEFVLRIDKQWNGDLKSLSWLRWIKGIKIVALSGPGVHEDVIAEVVRMKGLTTISLVDGELTTAAVQSLAKMPRIDLLEIRYVKIEPDVMDMLAKLPIRESLNLMGTGVPQDRIAKLKAELPGLSILYRRGGFMGVTCNTLGTMSCEITKVLPNSAAAAAKLRPRDVVTEIEGVKIEKFADLQAIINEHVPGDKLQLKYRRLGEEHSTTVELGRQDAQ